MSFSSSGIIAKGEGNYCSLGKLWAVWKSFKNLLHQTFSSRNAKFQIKNTISGKLLAKFSAHTTSFSTNLQLSVGNLQCLLTKNWNFLSRLLTCRCAAVAQIHRNNWPWIKFALCTFDWELKTAVNATTHFRVYASEQQLLQQQLHQQPTKNTTETDLHATVCHC